MKYLISFVVMGGGVVEFVIIKSYNQICMQTLKILLSNCCLILAYGTKLIKDFILPATQYMFH